MTIFGIKTELSPEVDKFMLETHYRLQSSDMQKNPYYGGVSKVAECTHLIDMTPIYPPFYLSGWLVLMLCLVWFKVWVLIVGLVLLSFGLVWSKYFLFFMLRLGLRKHGYKGPVRLICNKLLLNRMVNRII
jgi:hypothetical protein